jgi:hypothetical protein
MSANDRYSITPPVWGTGGCLASKHFRTPEGWLGIRHDGCDPNRGWTVTGVGGAGIRRHRDFGRFTSEKEAEDYAISLYYDMVRKWLTSIPIEGSVDGS